MRKAVGCWLLTVGWEAAGGCACGVPPPANPITEGRVMERRLAETLELAGTFRAEARAQQVTDRGPVRGRVHVFLRPPARIRFDSMSPVDTPLAVLVSDGVDFALHDISENRYYFGAAEACNIARLLHIVLPGEAVVRLLLGLPPPIDPTAAAIEWDDEGYYVYRATGTDGTRQTAHVAPIGDSLDTLYVEATDPSGRTWKATFEDRGDVDGYRLPRHVRFDAADGGGPVDLWYVEAEVRVDLPDDAWTYPGPPGIPAQQVTCDTVIEAPGWEHPPADDP